MRSYSIRHSGVSRDKIRAILNVNVEIRQIVMKRDHWGGLGVDGWVILEWISGRWDVSVLTGLGGPRIDIGGGRL